MASTLKKGDRIRLKTPTVSGFKGFAVVLLDYPDPCPDDVIAWRPEGCTDVTFLGISPRCQVVRCRDQQGMAQLKEEQS